MCRKKMKKYNELYVNFENIKNYFYQIGDAIDKSSLINHKDSQDNLYAIYEDKKLVYIGTSKKNNIYKRLDQHLNSCPSGTNSVLSNVNSSKGIIKFKTYSTEWDILRFSTEAYLISVLDPVWNKRGTTKMNYNVVISGKGYQIKSKD